MQAFVVQDGSLQWSAVEPASLQKGQVRIRIIATALNRADLLQCKGLYPPPPGYSDIPGLECAGEIIEVGEGVTGFAPGDAVCSLLAAGGYATEVVCDARQVLPVPAGLDYLQAAALPEVFATAWLNLFMLGEISAGEQVLLKAGASGVGTAAIQLCRAFGNPAFVSVGSDEKLQRCIELGASGGINRHHQSLLELKPEGPFDLVLDPVAGESMVDTMSLMKTDGRLMLIGIMDGSRAPVDFGRLLVKRLRIQGSTLRSLSVKRKGVVMSQLLEKVWPLVEAGDILPVIDKVMPLADIEEAMALMSGNRTFGKIVLSVDS